MKKIILLLGLFALSATATYAQTGKLTIVNNLSCDAYVVMQAVCSYNPTPCNMGSYQITAAPGTTTWAGATVFTNTIGWSLQTVTVPASYWTTPCCAVHDFNWTDAGFQFACGCYGGGVSSGSSIPTCYSNPPTWSNSCGYTATWTYTGTSQYDVTLTFNP